MRALRVVRRARVCWRADAAMAYACGLAQGVCACSQRCVWCTQGTKAVPRVDMAPTTRKAGLPRVGTIALALARRVRVPFVRSGVRPCARRVSTVARREVRRGDDDESVFVSARVSVCL